MPVPGGPETGQHGLDSVLTSAGEVELYSGKKKNEPRHVISNNVAF